jgi:hypothetical protein
MTKAVKQLVAVEGPCDVPNRLAFSEQLQGNLRLISIKLSRPAKAHAPLFEEKTRNGILSTLRI